MNVYDNANELAKAMRESHEFKKMVNEFLSLNQQAEMEKYQGKEPAKETTEKIQKLYGILSLNQDAMQYLNSFMRFQMMLADVTNSIQDVVKEAMGEK